MNNDPTPDLIAYYRGIVYSGSQAVCPHQSKGLAWMKLTQNKVRWLSRLMLGLVLFTQGVVTVHACVMPAAGATQAFVSDQDTLIMDASAMPACHQQDNANACLAHCTQSDQASAGQTAPLTVPAAIVSHIVIVPVVQRSYQTPYPEYVAHDSGPPLAIRFCSFLI